MSDNFDIDALISAEPPKELGTTDKKESFEKESSVSDTPKEKKEKKSLFAKKEKASASPSDKAKNKKMVLAIVMIGAIGGVICSIKIPIGTIALPQMNAKKVLNNSPTIAIPQNPTKQASIGQPLLPAGIAKNEQRHELPVPQKEDNKPLAMNNVTQPPKEDSKIVTTPTVDAPTPIPKVDEGNVASKEDMKLSDKDNNKKDSTSENANNKIIAEQKMALAKILEANNAMSSAGKDMKVEEKPKSEMKQEMKSETKVTPSLIVKEVNRQPMQKQSDGHSVRQMEIVELSKHYLKVNVDGKALKYSVGDILPGNARIIRIDMANEKVITNKGNIVIR